MGRVAQCEEVGGECAVGRVAQCEGVAGEFAVHVGGWE